MQLKIIKLKKKSSEEPKSVSWIWESEMPERLQCHIPSKEKKICINFPIIFEFLSVALSLFLKAGPLAYFCGTMCFDWNLSLLRILIWFWNLCTAPNFREGKSYTHTQALWVTCALTPSFCDNKKRNCLSHQVKLQLEYSC